MKNFEARIAKLADEQAHGDIFKFETAVLQALNRLLVTMIPHSGVINKVASAKHCVLNLVSESKDWPREIWETRRRTIEKEVLAQMDVVQRLLVSKGGDGSCVPAPEEDARAN